MKVALNLITLLLFFNCKTENSFKILDSSIINIIKDVTQGNEVNLGFRKLENGHISFYLLEFGIKACDEYYGTTSYNKQMVHLYLREGVVENDIKHLIQFKLPMECVLSKEGPEKITPPDGTLLYEYELIDGKFVKISAW